MNDYEDIFSEFKDELEEEVLGTALKDIKERLLSRVKTEITEHYLALEMRNDFLSKRNQELLLEKKALSEEKRQLEQDRKELDKKLKKFTVEDLLSNNLVKIYGFDYKVHYQKVIYTAEDGDTITKEIVDFREYNYHSDFSIKLCVTSATNSREDRSPYAYFQYKNNINDDTYYNDMTIYETLEELKEQKSLYNIATTSESVAKEYVEYMTQKSKQDKMVKHSPVGS